MKAGFSVWLLGLTAAVFLLQFFTSAVPADLSTSWVTKSFSLTPASLLWEPWTILTSVFLHASPMHLFFNMFALFFFGPLLEGRVGSKRFVALYLASGIVGSLGYVAYAYALGNPVIPALGASGAIFGILGALAVIEPNLTVYISFLFPLPMKYAVFFWIAVELFGIISYTSNVANAAHLAGLFAGVGYALHLKPKLHRSEAW